MVSGRTLAVTAAAWTFLSAAIPAPQASLSIESEAVRQFGLCLQPHTPDLAGPTVATLPPGLSRTGGIVAARIPPTGENSTPIGTKAGTFSSAALPSME